MSKFFINRPIVAMVISIIMMLIGLVAMVQLPIAQFPELAPPEILLNATYVGADALTLEQSVATPIEQQLQGVDNLIYMTSINSSSGLMRLRVDFDVGTDANTDQILTQMRYLQAESQLPIDVRNQGVTILKSATSPLALFSLYSPKGTYDAHFPRQLRVHQHQRSDEPRARRRPGGYLRRGQVRDAFLGTARHLGEFGDYRQRYHSGAQQSEYGERRRPNRRRAGSTRAGVYLHRARAGPSAGRRGVWQHRRARQPGRLHRTDEGCGSSGAGRPEIQSDRTP